MLCFSFQFNLNCASMLTKIITKFSNGVAISKPPGNSTKLGLQNYQNVWRGSNLLKIIQKRKKALALLFKHACQSNNGNDKWIKVLQKIILVIRYFVTVWKGNFQKVFWILTTAVYGSTDLPKKFWEILPKGTKITVDTRFQ